MALRLEIKDNYCSQLKWNNAFSHKPEANIHVICTLNGMAIVDFLRHFLGKQVHNYDGWQQFVYMLSLVLGSARAHRQQEISSLLECIWHRKEASHLSWNCLWAWTPVLTVTTARSPGFWTGELKSSVWTICPCAVLCFQPWTDSKRLLLTLLKLSLGNGWRKGNICLSITVKNSGKTPISCYQV